MLSRPPPVCTKVVGCVSSAYCQDWSLLLPECGQGLVPWSEVVSGRSSSLVCLFVANACLSCLVLGRSQQLRSWACCQMPPVVLHTITSMASGLYPKPCPSFGSMPKTCSCYLSNHLGFGPCCFSGILFDPCILSACSFCAQVTPVSRPVCFRGHLRCLVLGTWVSSCSVSTIGDVVVDVSGDSTAMFQLWSSDSISRHHSSELVLQPRAQLQLGSQVSMFLSEMSTFAVSDQTVHHCSVSACSPSQSALSAQRYSQGRQWLSHRLN